MHKENIIEFFEVKSFGKKFKELRKKAELKYLNFECFGYSKSSLSNYENDRRKVNKNDRKRLIEIIENSTNIKFNKEYYISSAEEELEQKVKCYGDALYNNSEAFSIVVNKALQLKMMYLIINIYYEKGKYLYAECKYRESVREYMSSLNYLNNSKFRRPEIYKSIADSFEKLNELSSCENYLRLALDINKKDSRLRFRCLLSLSRIYIELKNWVNCEFILDMIYMEYSEPADILYANMVRASMINNMGNVITAINFSKDKLTESPEEYKEYWLYNLGTYCVQAGFYHQAIIYFNRTLNSTREVISRSIIMNALADTYMLMKNFHEAECILDEIYDALLEIGEMFHILKWYENKIRIAEENKQFDKTEQLMVSATGLCSNYSEFAKWSQNRVKEIINIRRESGEKIGWHCESVCRMIG